MDYQVVRSCLIIALLASMNLWAIDEIGLGNTKGTPLGGLGTGYVVFDARTGDFAASGKVPPPGSDGVSEFSNKKSSSAGFHFYVAGSEGKKKAATTDEHAQCPRYFAKFPDVGGVAFTLHANGPFIHGNSTPLTDSLAHSPLAYFEVTAVNSGAAVDVAVGLEFSNTSGSINLLGGANSGISDAAMNNKAISFEGAGNTGNAYLMVECDNPAATYTSGTQGAFLTTGTLTNGAGNIVAAKCAIPANGTARFKFVISWWRTFIATTDRYGDGKLEENYYYHNYFADSKAAGQFGMRHFDAVSASVDTMVARIVGCNFPDWYKDRLLNNLYPLIHNAQCAKDGRVAFWEGHYPIIGTIDQGEHASLWYAFNWPTIQWRELRYWALTSHTGVGESAELKGQVHHDFNYTNKSETWSEQWTADKHFMCPWNMSMHNDYSYKPNTTGWADLNCMLIFKAYELMLATANADSLKTYFPYIKNTGDRIIRQSKTKHIPLSSESTYDTPEITTTPQYLGGIALVAYLAVVEIAKFIGEDSVAARYQNQYDLGKAEYKSDIFNSDFGTGRDFCEGDVAGYSFAHYFGFPAIMDSTFISAGCKRIWSYYSSISGLRDKLGLWHFYTYDHAGGAMIAIGQPDTAMNIHKWDYDYYYTGNPGYVFWQDLQKTNSTYMSYMTGPCVWRSYFQMTGTLLDNARKRLWLRPILPSSMQDSLANAPIINPNGWGTFNWNGKKDAQTKVCQRMAVKFDLPVKIKEIVLKNNTTIAAPGVIVTHNGANVPVSIALESSSSFEKNIRVTLLNEMTVGTEGVAIKVVDDIVPVRDVDYNASPSQSKLSLQSKHIGVGAFIHYAIEATGPVSMEMIGLNGSKLGTLMRGHNRAGEHSFIWDGRFLEGNKPASGIAIVVLRSAKSTISQKVLVGR